MTAQASETKITARGDVRSDQKGNPARFLSLNGALLAIGVIFLVPVVWVIFASFDANATIKLQWPTWTLVHYGNAFDQERLLGLWSSIEISVLATLISTAPAIIAAYALSRLKVPGGMQILVILLILSGVPITVLIIPVYQLLQALDMLSLFPAAVFLGVTALPFEIYIIKNAIDGVPRDLEEAARIEGASNMTVIRKVILPLAFPGIVSAAIYGFVNAWGSFIVPFILLNDVNSQPGPVKIYTFIGSAYVKYGDVAAYSVLYSLPVILLYLAVARFFQSGFMMSGAVR
jgi:multiple sugar transport system permease protein